MAVPAYEEDLTDISLAENTTNWSEPGATTPSYALGGTPTAETDYFLQGAGCVSQSSSKTGLSALLFNNGNTIIIPTDGAILLWQYFGAPNSIDTVANGGMRVLIGSSITAFNVWYVGGEDFSPYPYGGWVNHAVNHAVTADATVGSPGVPTYVGAAVNVDNAVSKGNPHGVDAIRVGRCEMRIYNGSVADGFATFAGYAAQNDNNSNRWGLFQAVAGGYQWKGLMTLGYSAAVDFRDSNKSIVIQNTTKVTANFNKIEIRQASSRVDWTNISITALGTVSRGRFEMIDAADVNLDGCTFTDMDTFVFLSTGSSVGCTWRRCNAVTANGASFANCLFTNSTVATNASALIWNTATDPDGLLDGTEFSKGTGTTHAIEFGTSSPTTMTLTDVIFTGYNASNNQDDSAIHVKRTTGTVTINISGGTSPSYRTDGATVVIVAGAVSATVTCKTTAGANIQNARVLLKAEAGGPFPSNVTVTITNSGTTATVTHTGHGLATNDKVLIDGASHWQNNGVFSITVTGNDNYTYTMPEAPGSNPTGTIKSTFVVLEGLTDVNGQITMSRVFPSDQPVSGWARKSSTAPYYKTSTLTGTVDNTAGFSATAVMISDE